MTSQQRLCLIGLLAGCFLVSLDSTIVATASPRIVAELGAAEWYSWIAGGYMLGFSVVIPLAGRLVDLMNGRRLLVASTALFLAASLGCGAASSMEGLVAWRALQGIGGGAMMAVTLGLAGLLYGPAERAVVTAWYAALVGVASVLGPLLGGVLTDHVSWRAVFYVNLPVGLVSLGFLMWTMPDMVPEGRGKIDGVGAGLLVGWSVPLLLALSGVDGQHPLATARGQGLLACTAILLVLFVVVERRVASPLFDFALLGNRVFTLGSLANAAAGGAYIGAVLYLPLYFVSVLGMTATWAGLALTPVIVGQMLGSAAVGGLMKRVRRSRALALAGALLAIPALLGFRATLGAASFALTVGLLVGVGVAFGLMTTVYPVAVQNSVDRARMGTASSFLQFLRSLGQTVAIALMGSMVLESKTHLLVDGIRSVFLLSTALVVGALVCTLMMPDPDVGSR